MQNSPIFSKTHDLLTWLIPQTLKFPKTHRAILAKQVQDAVFEFQARLLDARCGINQMLSLRRADACLLRLRSHLRLSVDWQFLTTAQFEYVCHLLLELGRLLGGWVKTLQTSLNAKI